MAMSRDGDAEAFAELFRRYRRPAIAIAAGTSTVVDPEDAAADAFTRILQALRNGHGPDRAFRPYLASAVRNVIVTRSSGPQEFPTDTGALAAALRPTQLRLNPDGGVETSEVSLVMAAFESLPARWQAALWATEVEGTSIAELATAIGVTDNTASALCFRAREGLRTAWLQAHVDQAPASDACRWVVRRLSAHARAQLTDRQRSRVEQHLAGCPACAATHHRLTLVSGSLRAAPGVDGDPVTNSASVDAEAEPPG